MQKPIFNSYTGSAFLNNALQTIEVLGNTRTVQEITPQLIEGIYKKYEIWNLFTRMKSYSMLFTRNGPLLNDKEYGEKIFKGLIEYILENHETDGEKTCEISGLKFQTTFEAIYEKVLNKIKYPAEKIQGKDKTINRCWFPLIGALGSDAQALPQAKFGISIHPICLVIIQFLPFSALIYKGGILLFDSTNFKFSKDFIEESTKRVLAEIDLTAEGKSIENIKDFNKGTYLLKALKLFSEKKDDYDDTYSELNLWSFSNSGTGANCEIDRVPNQFFKKLLQLYYDVECRSDLEKLISDSKLSTFFLEKLEANLDFWGLYPLKNYDGVGVPFYEKFQKLVGNAHLIDYAKYIAYLLKDETQLNKSDLKLLEKTDAYKDPAYKTIVFITLVRASENKKWSIENHLQILDNPAVLPVNSATFRLFKLIHFYYQKDARYLLTKLPESNINGVQSRAGKALFLVISLIESYEKTRNINIRSRLLNPHEAKAFNLQPILIAHASKLDLEEIYEFYFKDFKRQSFSLNDLLRIYFLNPVEASHPETAFEITQTVNLNKYRSLAALYTDYYYSKYQNTSTGEFPYIKFRNHVLIQFPKNTTHFKKWLEDSEFNMLSLLKEQKEPIFTKLTKVEISKLFKDVQYDDLGNSNLSFARFAIEFSLHNIYSLTN
ncbi:MAG: hypothetical protein R2828_29215 [Saprospiraceae bacterium]